MSYFRVIPRDLFNEGNLLKCIGKLYIETERFMDRVVSLEHDGEAFDIWQDENDGSLTVLNIQFRIGGVVYPLKRPLNSRQLWPLQIEVNDELVAVFTEDGALTDEVLGLINSRSSQCA